MHIPNGFLDPKVSAGAAFAAAGVLGFCIAKVRQALSIVVPESVLAGAGNIGCTITEGSKKVMSNISSNHLMKMGAIGSLIFSAQMFNFPVASGTSGHLLGGIIAALAVGPFSGVLVMAVILFVQSLVFADGGITALGANILNMAVIGTLVSYYIYYLTHKLIKNDTGFHLGILLAAFCSVFLASIACALEIAWSGTSSLDKVLPAMALVHAKIGAAEGLITIIGIQLLLAQGFILEGKVINEKK